MWKCTLDEEQHAQDTMPLPGALKINCIKTKRENRFHACGARVCSLCRCRPPQGLYGDVAGLGQEKKQFY